MTTFNRTELERLHHLCLERGITYSFVHDHRRDGALELADELVIWFDEHLSAHRFEELTGREVHALPGALDDDYPANASEVAVTITPADVPKLLWALQTTPTLTRDCYEDIGIVDEAVVAVNLECGCHHHVEDFQTWVNDDGPHGVAFWSDDEEFWVGDASQVTGLHYIGTKYVDLEGVAS